MKSRLFALAALAAFGAASFAGSALEVSKQSIAAPRPVRNEKRIRAGGITNRRNKRGAGPGWSFAHVKRMAQKRRNVVRNRKAHR